MLFPKLNSNTKIEQLLPKDREKITFGQMVLAIAFILLAFSSCATTLSNKQLASKRITNVQLSDGTAILVQQQDGNYRDKALIKQFVSQWVSLTFSWDGTIPGTQEKDPGIELPNKQKIPTTAWTASWMLEPKFGQTFLEELTQLLPKGVLSGDLQSAAIVRYVSDPQTIDNVTWRVNVIADRILFNRATNSQYAIIPFNKTITIKATAIPTSPLKDKANFLEKIVYKMRVAGLEIQDCYDYKP